MLGPGAWGATSLAILHVIDATKGEQCGGRSDWRSAGLHGGQSKYQRGEDGGFCFCLLFHVVVDIIGWH